MTQRQSIPLAAAIFLAIPALSRAQLPVTQPTTMPGLIAAGPVVTHGRHAVVIFQDGLLNVRADNSSLNVILREISRKTGMTITGGVADDRVFGNYGPADPGTVIATLLGGSGVNLLFRADENNNPTELILTPRTGGATPPNPTSPQFDEEARAEEATAAPQPLSNTGAVSAQPVNNYTPPPATVTNTDYNPNNSNKASSTPVPDPNVASPVSTPPSMPQPANNVNGDSANRTPSASEIPTVQSVPLNSLPTPSTTPSSSGIVDTPNPAPAGTTASNPSAGSATATTTAPDGTTTTTTVTSPNGTPTAEDIAAKIMALQKANQQKTTTK
jgi:hypothetical protein